MKLLMMGTGPFAVPTFQRLLQSQHEVVALVTRPTVIGVGKKAPINPMREAAEAHGVNVVAPEDVNAPESLTQLRAWQPDLLVVCDYGQILSPEALTVAPLGGINLHGSLLPKYRGAAPVQWCVWNGDPVSGSTVIHLTPRLDGGPILATVTTDVLENETAAELESRLAELGVQPVLDAIQQLERLDGVTPIGQPQDQSLVTKAPRLHKSQGQIDWSQDAEKIRNQIRAFQPWPGSFTYWHRGDSPLRLILTEVQLVPDPPLAEGSAQTPKPGQIIVASKSEVWVQTGRGVLALKKLQPAGKRVMEITEFLRGYPFMIGQTLAENS